MEWIANFILRLFGRERQQPGDGWSDLMHAYQELNTKLEARIDHLENQLASIEAALEADRKKHAEQEKRTRAALDEEREAHSECQKKLRALEERLASLERRADQRDDNDAGS